MRKGNLQSSNRIKKKNKIISFIFFVLPSFFAFSLFNCAQDITAVNKVELISYRQISHRTCLRGTIR